MIVKEEEHDRATSYACVDRTFGEQPFNEEFKPIDIYIYAVMYIRIFLYIIYKQGIEIEYV